MQILKKGLERGNISFSKSKPYNFANLFNIRDAGNLGGCWPIITSNPDLIYIPLDGFTKEIENMELPQKYHNDINVDFCYDFLQSQMLPLSLGICASVLVVSGRKTQIIVFKIRWTFISLSHKWSLVLFSPCLLWWFCNHQEPRLFLPYCVTSLKHGLYLMMQHACRSSSHHISIAANWKKELGRGPHAALQPPAPKVTSMSHIGYFLHIILGRF